PAPRWATRTPCSTGRSISSSTPICAPSSVLRRRRPRERWRSMIDLAGRVAVVTGAGRGLGRAYALALAGAGARVVVNDVGCAADGSGTDPAVAEAVAAEIQAVGGAAVADTTAVGTAEAGTAIVSRAVAAFGRLDVLVSNAGVSASHPFADFPPGAFDAI